jgi:DNA polymerase elongation subunit (family B)
MSSKLDTINEIKAFLDGHNDELKYVVNVEVDVNTNIAECIVHEPEQEKKILQVPFTPFMYMKDLKKLGKVLYNGDEDLMKEKMIQFGIRMKRMKTGNQKRLEEGFCFKLTSSKSYNSIIYFLRDGGLYPYEKQLGEDGQPLVNRRGDPIWINRHLFYAPKPTEQFFIDKGVRLYKGFEEYKDVHKVIFDIETTGLRPEISRMFEIGVWDNRGREVVLEVDEPDDDEAEANLIIDFFNLIDEWQPAVIAGFNSEDFDFYYILERAKILKLDLNKIITTLKRDVKIRRIPNSSVKIGNSA